MYGDNLGVHDRTMAWFRRRLFAVMLLLSRKHGPSGRPRNAFLACPRKDNMTSRPALVTGFAPYGGRGSNPACEAAYALDGRTVGGVRIHGRALPVSSTKLRDCASALLHELDPSVVISIGLWPGEPMIRIERFGHNLADFEIPDNEGTVLVDQPLGANGPNAFKATVPVQRIQSALLAAGIPARLSSSAGTFLCNACLFSFLSAIEASPRPALCGFLHVPYQPAQVAEIVATTRAQQVLELHQRADLASMELGTVIRAVEIALALSLEEAAAMPGFRA
jgi:pyroglutamyl-peptidase